MERKNWGYCSRFYVGKLFPRNAMEWECAERVKR